MRDLIIIGASGAGVSAAIYAVRRNLDFIIVGKDFGGEIASSGEIENYPGFPHTNGIELSSKLREHLKSYDVEPQLGITVENVEQIDGGFRASGTDGSEDAWSEEARAVIVATGQHPRHLGVPGEDKYRNKGVSYCTTCDGPLFKDKPVAIVGGGNTANEAGIMLNGIASDVKVLTIHEDMKGDDILIKKLKEGENVEVIGNANTTEISGDGDMVTGLTYEDKETGEEHELEVEGIFIHIGWIPNADMVKDLVDVDDYGQIKVDRLGKTSVTGVFAAGDVTDIPYKQIGVAVGQGIAALLSAVDYLNKLEA